MLNLIRLCLLVTVFILIHSQVHAFTLNSGSDSSMKGWANHTVGFKLNPSNCPSGIHSILDSAMEVWNAVPSSDLAVSLSGETATTNAQLASGTATDVPVIICDTNFSADSGIGGNGIAGVARVASPAAGGHVSYAYLLINVEPGSSGNISSANPTVVSVVLAHEIGHVLGLGHSPDINALMYYNATEKSHLTLGQDDIDGITYLYPRNELGNQAFGCGHVATLDSNSGPGSPSGSAAAIFIALLLLPLGIAGWAARDVSRNPIASSMKVVIEHLRPFFANPPCRDFNLPD